VCNKLFAFRTINIFFGGILASSFSALVGQLSAIANSPLSIITILGTWTLPLLLLLLRLIF
jgi:hypothetical protein